MILNYINNQQSYDKLINDILNNVLENVSQKLLEDFQNHLDKTVYSPRPSLPYDIQDPYKRLKDKGGFYSGWDIDRTKNLIRTLYFDGDKLASPTWENHLAHSGSDENGDVRDMMHIILNSIQMNKEESYWEGAYYISQYGGSIGYWDSYLKGIDKKITQWLDEEFKRYGITRR